ncbi:hypothetical protein PanWU01x14_146700 [Parasponia andersonii]|uniref:Uncharacterized protein n=1 Tax=Parasponia andersonii TaxID=3476 RepID=A0A2P5CJR3_PARAD|nr:hypothetical protein PanWU01x14_146700 [Parasponia andersonii]
MIPHRPLSYPKLGSSPSPDSGWTRPSPILISTAGGSEAPRVFHQNTMERTHSSRPRQSI